MSLNPILVAQELDLGLDNLQELAQRPKLALQKDEPEVDGELGHKGGSLTDAVYRGALLLRGPAEAAANQPDQRYPATAEALLAAGLVE